MSSNATESPTASALPRRPSKLERGLPEWVMIAVGLVALTTLAAQYGFHLDAEASSWIGRVDVAIAVLFGADLLSYVARAESLRVAVRRRWFELLLLALLMVSLLVLARLQASAPGAEHAVWLGARSLPKLYLAAVQAFLLGVVVARVLRSQERLLERRLRPELVLVVSFGLLVLFGACLLLLPRARAAGAEPWSVVDALFTATSAACVTGLAVRDTGSELSGLGQWFLLTVFQLGGLGIVTFVAAGQVFSSRRMSVPQMVLLEEVLATGTLANVRRGVRAVVLVAVVLELGGALILFVTLPGEPTDLGARAFWCLFHSVSAFCNAGFSLQSDSLESLRGAWGVNLTVIALIVIGGLGMPVLRDLWSWARAGGVGRLLRRRRRALFERPPRMSVQTRLTLWATLALLVVGCLGFLVLEGGHALAGLPWHERVLASLFQGVTPRTAGFDTVAMGELRSATRVLMIALMVVGAGPISTGGGVKTVTCAVLIVTLTAMVRGRDDVEVGGRSIPRRIVRAALSVFVIYLIAGGLVLFALTLCEPGLPFESLAFETYSALGTVGLSMGITAELGTASKLVLCLAMFVGRVGPLALALSIFRSRGRSASYRFPEENLIVG